MFLGRSQSESFSPIGGEVAQIGQWNIMGDVRANRLRQKPAILREGCAEHFMAAEYFSHRLPERRNVQRTAEP
jgi:hypothetical protein